MRMVLTALPLAFSLVLISGCGSDDATSDSNGSAGGAGAAGSDGGGGASANEPPTPNGTTLELREGLATTLPFDEFSTGNTVAELIDVPSGIEAKLGDGTVELFADYRSADAATLGVKLEAGHEGGGVTADAAIDLAVKALSWGANHRDTATGPEAREHAAVIVDEAGGRMILHGGSGYSPYLDPLDDTWAYDLNTLQWSELEATGDIPSGGGSRRVAQIPGTSRAFLHGGYGEGGRDNDELYEVDFSDGGVHFTKVLQLNTTGVRALHAFFYDAESERFFIFGGVGRNDVWQMQLTDSGSASWTKLTLDDEGPTPRYGFFWGFDAANRRLVVYSGAQGTATLDPAHDTWALDVSVSPPKWTLLDDGSSEEAPPGRRNGCMSFDPTGPRLFIFGGTPDAQTSAPGFYVFDARPGHEKWTRLEREGEPVVRSSGVGFYDPIGERNFFGFGNTRSAAYNDLTPLQY